MCIYIGFGFCLFQEPNWKLVLHAAIPDDVVEALDVVTARFRRRKQRPQPPAFAPPPPVLLPQLAAAFPPPAAASPAPAAAPPAPPAPPAMAPEVCLL